MFYGLMTALVTPFTREGGVDEKAFLSYVEWQIDEGVDGLVVLGTTGESPTLDKKERLKLIELCVGVCRRRVPIIVGIGTSSTQTSLEQLHDAHALGANAVLAVTPCYNRPTQNGLYEHYKALAQASSLPIIVYNIPFRSGVDILPETLGRLVQDCKNIVGIKDSTGNLERVLQQRAACGKDFLQLSGDDFSSSGFNAQGGSGSISVVSNVAPALCVELQKATLEGNRQKTLDIQDLLFPLCQAIFRETGAAGAKYGLSCLDKMENNMRSPLMKVDSLTEERIYAAMKYARVVGS